MNGNDIVNILVPKLLDMNFIVHRYNSHSTSSIYLKLDYGVCCGIRIADHPGKKKYHYRFNVFKDYKGDKVIKRGKLISYFFTFEEIPQLLEKIKIERDIKIEKYGIDNYKEYMDKNLKENDLFTRFKMVV